MNGRVASRTTRRVPVLAPGADRHAAARAGGRVHLDDGAGDRPGGEGPPSPRRARPPHARRARRSAPALGLDGYRARLVAWAWREPGPAIGGLVGLVRRRPGWRPAGDRGRPVARVGGCARRGVPRHHGRAAGRAPGRHRRGPPGAGPRPRGCPAACVRSGAWLVARWTAIRVRLTGRSDEPQLPAVRRDQRPRGLRWPAAAETWAGPGGPIPGSAHPQPVPFTAWSVNPMSDTTPSVAEIAALTARLRALSNAGPDADPQERARFLADKDALLARIAAAGARAARPDTRRLAPRWADYALVAPTAPAPGAPTPPTELVARPASAPERRTREPGRPLPRRPDPPTAAWSTPQDQWRDR